MSEPNAGVNAAPVGLVPLPNVQLFMKLVDRLQNRSVHTPGIGVFYGWSGLGKTASATYASHRTRSFYIECGDTWTKKTLLEAMTFEVTASRGKGSVPVMAEYLVQVLKAEGRPFIIDEADYLVKKSIINTVRHLSEMANIPIILIGEESLPQKLEVFERVHNRVLEWVPAQPCTPQDAVKLAAHYAHDLQIDAALLKRIVTSTGGVTRRVVVNIEAVKEFARENNLKKVGLDTYPESRIFTGRPPLRQRNAMAGGVR